MDLYVFHKLVAEDVAALSRDRKFSWMLFVRYLFTSPGFQVVFLYRISFSLRRIRLNILSFLVDRLALHFWGAEIRSTAKIQGGLRVAHPVGLVVGGKVSAGRNLSLRQGTTLGGNTKKAREGEPSWTQPRLGHDVIIGCNSAVLGPIDIGDGAMIGACSLVISDVAPHSRVGGVPAKILPQYRNE